MSVGKGLQSKPSVPLLYATVILPMAGTSSSVLFSCKKEILKLRGGGKAAGRSCGGLEEKMGRKHGFSLSLSQIPWLGFSTEPYTIFFFVPAMIELFETASS